MRRININNIIKRIILKLSSRKLWAAIAGISVGVAIAFGIEKSLITTISGSIVSALSVMSYIITEGKIDAANVSQVMQNIETIVGAVSGAEEMKGEDE